MLLAPFYIIAKYATEVARCMILYISDSLFIIFYIANTAIKWIADIVSSSNVNRYTLVTLQFFFEVNVFLIYSFWGEYL